MVTVTNSSTSIQGDVCTAPPRQSVSKDPLIGTCDNEAAAASTEQFPLLAALDGEVGSPAWVIATAPTRPRGSLSGCLSDEGHLRPVTGGGIL